MALLITGLAVYAAGPGASVILGSAVAGLAIAVLYLRRNNR
jgi:hypothetical protein